MPQEQRNHCESGDHRGVLRGPSGAQHGYDDEAGEQGRGGEGDRGLCPWGWCSPAEDGGAQQAKLRAATAAMVSQRVMVRPLRRTGRSAELLRAVRPARPLRPLPLRLPPRPLRAGWVRMGRPRSPGNGGGGAPRPARHTLAPVGRPRRRRGAACRGMGGVAPVSGAGGGSAPCCSLFSPCAGSTARTGSTVCAMCWRWGRRSCWAGTVLGGSGAVRAPDAAGSSLTALAVDPGAGAARGTAGTGTVPGVTMPVPGSAGSPREGHRDSLGSGTPGTPGCPRPGGARSARGRLRRRSGTTGRPSPCVVSGRW